MLEATLKEDEYLSCAEPSLCWCEWCGDGCAGAALSPIVAYAGSSTFAALSAEGFAFAFASEAAAALGIGSWTRKRAPPPARAASGSPASDDWLRVSGDGDCWRRSASARDSLKSSPVGARFASHLTTKSRTLSTRHTQLLVSNSHLRSPSHS